MSLHPAKKAAPADAREAALVYSIEAGLESLRAELAGTRNAVTLRGAEAKPLTGASQQLTTSPTRLLGWSIHETSGTAPATVRLTDAAAGDVLAVVPLAAGAGETLWLGPGGIGATISVYADVAGAVEGAVYVLGA